MTKKAFTLLELIVVISIMGVLITILLPSLRNAKEVSMQAVCMSNMKQITKASFQYSTENRTYIVPSAMHHSFIPDYPNTTTASASARYGDYYLLGKYGINPKPEGSVWSGIEGWTPDKNSVLRCPSAKDKDTQTSKFKSRIAINTLAFKGVTEDKGYSILITQQEVLNPDRLVGWVDSRLARFHPGYSKETRGNEDPTPTADINYTYGAINSAYNWVKRHRKGSNIGFTDGHVAFSRNLQRDVANDKFFVKNE
ncbi:MAG: type II secretion system GspH family protein [Lentisphaerales bacterium]|nr:type II secretion system GspH family protein [Lentisphaerales bacterium]